MDAETAKILAEEAARKASLKVDNVAVHVHNQDVHITNN
jgi:hypothetical protein